MPSRAGGAAQLPTEPSFAPPQVQGPGLGEVEISDGEQSDGPPGARPGIYQGSSSEFTWLFSGSDAHDFGIFDIELKEIFGFPCPTRQSPLIVTPGFAVHFFDGPKEPDLPGQVYDAYMQFRWMRQLGPRWGVDLAVTPGWYSDWEQGSHRALRISGYGAGRFTWTPQLKIALGVAYLDREDLNVLPVGGLIWTPREDWNFELVAPRPRIAWRAGPRSPSKAEEESWLYLAGELGGGAWAIQRASGANDLVSYHDYRVILGTEHKKAGRSTGWTEVGYVFWRKLEYRSGPEEIEPSDTLFLRLGSSY